MRPCSRLLLSVIFLCALCAAAQAQRKTLCPKPPPSPFKHNGRIYTSVGRGGARTTLEHPLALSGGGGATLYMGASFVHADPRRPSAPVLDLVVYSAEPAPGAPPVPAFAPGQGLALFYDGQPLAIAGRAGFRSQDGVQAARMTLTYADVAKLTHARKVSARVGAAEYEFTSNHLEALRELVSQMAPSPGRWTADTAQGWTTR